MFIAAAAAALVACGDSGGGGGGKVEHAICKDDASSAAYVEKSMAEISQAVIDKKITAEQAQKAGEKLLAANKEANGENGKGSAWYCTQIDAVKKELGL